MSTMGLAGHPHKLKSEMQVICIETLLEAFRACPTSRRDLLDWGHKQLALQLLCCMMTAQPVQQSCLLLQSPPGQLPEGSSCCRSSQFSPRCRCLGAREQATTAF